jgi:hypothetical protein
MLIGTSLGRCLTSILDGDVKIDDVACIITRTKAHTWDELVLVIKEYHEHGNRYGNNRPSDYNLGQFDWELVLDIASKLWYSGRIHQPRNYMDGSINRPSFPYHDLWLEIVPTPSSATPAVVEAYQQYQMLKTLAGEE